MERITVRNGVATAWRDGEQVGQWQAGPDEYAAAGLEWPGCTCGDNQCQHDLAHYWGEGWAAEHVREIARHKREW